MANDMKTSDEWDLDTLLWCLLESSHELMGCMHPCYSHVRRLRGVYDNRIKPQMVYSDAHNGFDSTDNENAFDGFDPILSRDVKGECMCDVVNY